MKPNPTQKMLVFNEIMRDFYEMWLKTNPDLEARRAAHSQLKRITDEVGKTVRKEREEKALQSRTK